MRPLANALAYSVANSVMSNEEFFQKRVSAHMLRIAPNVQPGTVAYIPQVSTKLLITEITRMGSAFCVIGLQREGGRVQSLRPVRSLAKSWRRFPYQRGDVIKFSLLATPGKPPHVEDRVTTRDFRKSATISEPDVVAHLRNAECAESLRDLFGCAIRESKRGAYALPEEARRSICGCPAQNLRFEFCGKQLRAKLVLASGELLDLPVVDRDWLGFVDDALAENRGPNRAARLRGFLNSQFQYKVISCAHHFIRIGLSRPFSPQSSSPGVGRNVCWLMLDTLFPLPKVDWLEEF